MPKDIRTGALAVLVLAALVPLPTIYRWAIGAPDVHAPITIGQDTIGPTPTTTEQTGPTPAPLYQYITVSSSCGPYFDGACVVARSGPGTEYPVVLKLREGIVLKTSDSIQAEGHIWYKIAFDEWLRYPERVQGDLYVAGDYVSTFFDEGPKDHAEHTHATSTKKIVVNRTTQTLSAYDGDTLFMEQKISTGLDLTPTPVGTFHIYRKTPSRYMQGPIPELSDQYYDLPGVPWNMYFTEQGGAIHGAYWHNNFGQQWSHGCVNMPTDQAKKLYEWADVGTPVVVID